MKATDRVRRNKIDVASENLFGEHVEPSGAAVAWWLS